jgi:hypothetical protein
VEQAPTRELPEVSPPEVSQLFSSATDKIVVEDAVQESYLMSDEILITVVITEC